MLDKLMSELSNTSSPGVSGIHAKVIKAAAITLSPLFTSLFNKRFEQNMMPDEWKIALVNPLFKKNSRSDINNYRGISVLPPIVKLFEKILVVQITLYFEENNLFYSGQHSFRKGFSCETALHELISEIYNASFSLMT